MLEGELQMMVAGLDKIVPALGIDKILEQGVPQETLDRLAPGLKTEQVDRLMGTLDRMLPGLGNVVRQKAPAALGAGVSMIGKKTTLEGKPAQDISAAVRRRCGVSRPVPRRADAAAVLKLFLSVGSP